MAVRARGAAISVLATCGTAAPAMITVFVRPAPNSHRSSDQKPSTRGGCHKGGTTKSSGSQRTGGTYPLRSTGRMQSRKGASGASGGRFKEGSWRGT
ncbi:hypothetical protein BKA82DRAFT_993329 [Pisolithus tinctorius]|uniref:Uncharacterized protein n=1 Tax=Pisolithus tinctorius Marx 270 TaxID=870435 RepID=A0A0C3PET0_PISTI|nr:hypothetical protein BKA82DRAFT_993329 [Pisolithus tinctorius]KIO12325.1 hypothetical protein M404DRAFT_993329 [Pisolithus tinctorius Marx 270]